MIDLRLKDDIFGIQDEISFRKCALIIFKYQSIHCEIYRRYLSILGINPESVTHIHEIPFLPIELFKDSQVLAEGFKPQLIFRSSGTSNAIQSTHYIADAELYRQSLLRGFNLFFGSPKDYVFLALLPSYLERNDASLAYMLDQLMKASGHPLNGFYLDHSGDLLQSINALKSSGQKFILWGVSFALLDLAREMELDLSGNIVLETGGMKGREKEWVKDELHEFLRTRFHLPGIYSEYGMMEMLSQAYAISGNAYRSVPWMKVILHDLNDPQGEIANGQTGVINVIDLANIYSCSFIATQDLGKMNPDGTFEVLGRVDYSDVRGCSLMV